MGAAGVLLLFLLPVNCTSDGARPSAPVAEQVAPPPPAPSIPQHTVEEVIVEADTALVLSDTLPLDSLPQPAPARASASADTTVLASAAPVAIDSTDEVDTTSSEPPSDSLATPVGAVASIPMRPDTASASTGTDRAVPQPPSVSDGPRPQMSAFAAAVAGTPPERSPSTPGITGLVTDETQTKVGRDFYDAFYDAWQPPSDDRYYNVTVTEQPLPNLGTRVAVRLNHQDVFQTRLQPQHELIQQAARHAVHVVQRRLRSNPSTNVF